ncbi:hypothetical protein YC2023_019366 [Brassica napus]
MRLRFRRCVSKLSLLDESPKRHENLTEGVNLKPVSFMSQFHRSRPDCNLCASWLDPLYDLDQALRKFTEESKIRYAWSKYAELERSLAETELARTIFELAISQYEEYIDYLYPEESQTTNLKILEAAYKWKKQKLAASEEDYDYYQVSFELYQNCELIFFGLC